MNTSYKPRRLARLPYVCNQIGADAGSAAGSDQTESVETHVTKQELVVALLHREGGAPLEDLVAATNWLPHTIRAAMTGLRKKGHAIIRNKVDGVTRYAILSGPAE